MNATCHAEVPMSRKRAARTGLLVLKSVVDVVAVNDRRTLGCKNFNSDRDLEGIGRWYQRRNLKRSTKLGWRVNDEVPAKFVT